MNKFLKLYIKLIPVFALIGVFTSVLRTVIGLSLVREMLLVYSAFDIIIVFFNMKKLKDKRVFILIFLMGLSVVVGFLNDNLLSRRYITDVTLPVFFFCKSVVFANYWDGEKFTNYLKYYTKITFFGSLVLLPFAYYFFNQNGATRMAIFPPLELTFAHFIQSGGLFLFITFLMIILYGKRAQLLGAIITFISFIYLSQKKGALRYLTAGVFLWAVIYSLYVYFPDNLAMRRISKSIEIFDSEKGMGNASKISSGRDEEIKAVLDIMRFPDYFLGKGVGFTYNLIGEKEQISNLHFSPLSFLSKYGMLFTIFVYIYMIRILIPNRSLLNNRNYVAAYGTIMFFFIESFFAYTIFVTPVLPVVIGYLLSLKKNNGALNN